MLLITAHMPNGDANPMHAEAEAGLTSWKFQLLMEVLSLFSFFPSGLSLTLSLTVAASTFTANINM